MQTLIHQNQNGFTVIVGNDLEDCLYKAVVEYNGYQKTPEKFIEEYNGENWEGGSHGERYIVPEALFLAGGIQQNLDAAIDNLLDLTSEVGDDQEDRLRSVIETLKKINN